MSGPRIGFFSRVLDTGSPADRYRLALEQIAAADRFGFAGAWLAQHHFGESEGGLPSPFVLLAAAAERTERIGLGTAVLTLPLEDPVRAAEDAAVLDALSGGRVQLGVASGGSPGSFAAFLRDPVDRGTLSTEHLDVFRDALLGFDIRGTGSRIYPPGGDLGNRVWQATFSSSGGERAGRAGDGLMLSRTQPRDPSEPDADLSAIQQPIVDAYRAALPAGSPVRILASRTVLVVDAEHRTLALELAEVGLRAAARGLLGHDGSDLTLDELVAATDTHIGTVDEVVESLSADAVAAQASDVSFQVHSIAATHELTVRSIELLATEVAPRLGWNTSPGAGDELRRAHRANPADPAEPAPAARTAPSTAHDNSTAHDKEIR